MQAETNTRQAANMALRTIAAIVDMIALGALFYVMALANGGVKTGNGFSVHLNGGPFILYLVFAFLYFILLEWLIGATIGKLLFGLRVRKADGSRLSLGQSLARNLLRFIDGFPYFLPYLVGFVVAMTGRERKRVGDRAADTIV